MHFSVLSTLKEALNLWMRNLGILILAAIVITFPSHVLGVEEFRSDSIPLTALQRAAKLVLGVIFNAAATAAVLNILCRRAEDKIWLVGVQGVCRYGGELVGVSVLLFVIIFGASIPLGLLVGLSLFHYPFLMVIFYAFFLFLLKYALAKPLVVAKNMKAWQALVVSWRMTQNRFWYVLGCYVIFGVIEGLIFYGSVRLVAGTPFLRPVEFMHTVLSTYWIILSWVMYLRIKAGDEIPPVVAVETAWV